MARRLLLTAALGLIVSGTGCVSREKFEAQKMAYLAAQEQASANQVALARTQAERDALAKSNEGLTSGLANADERVRLTDEQLKAEQARSAALDQKTRELLSREPQVVMGALPPELNAALKQLASNNSTLMEYDANRGMIKFKNDLTFATSSDQLTPAAKTAVQQLAGILNSPAARSFEFLVAGHTDNIPVTKQETIRAGHKDNWYLSTHRAVSVAKELMANKVGAERVGALGYGDQRAAADNTTAAGRAKNRRVEVLILPTRVHSAGSTAGLIGNTPAKAAAPQRDLNKDTAVDLRDTGPVLDK